jgi:predicted enzyme related to lactoylglutathione lyase
MPRVTGLGGIFLKCRDLEHTRSWYSRHFGLALESWGIAFNWKEADPAGHAYSVLGFFGPETDYFQPSDQSVMINLRVDDLDGMLQQLRAEGIPIAGEPVEEEFGKFAWVLDPDGRKVELWQQ